MPIRGEAKLMFRVHPVHLLLLFFAVIGFIREIIYNTVNTFVMIGFFVVIFWLLNNYQKTGRFLPRFQANKPFRGNHPAQKRFSASSKQKPGKPKHNPFQVIEGSKGKNKSKEKQ